MDKLKNIPFYNILLILIIFAGIILRLIFYSYGRPLWLDECALALNITDGNNYFALLNHDQAAPPFFMYISKMLYNVLPVKAEYSLRLFPLICSILSIPVFVLLVNKIFQSKISRITALLIFVFNYRICYYAQEFKQYSVDLFFFLLIITSYLYTNSLKIAPPPKRLIYGILLAISIWFSNASVIAIGTIGVIELYKVIKNKSNIKNLLFMLVPALISLCIYYIVCYDTIHSSVLHKYWDYAFINKGLEKLAKLAFNNTKYFFKYPLINLILITSGFIKFISCRKEKNYLLIIPVFILLIFSFLSIYPFAERLILFCLPLFAIYIANLCEIKNKILTVVLILTVLIFNIFPSFKYTKNMIIKKNYYYEDIVTPLVITANLIKPQDTIIIDPGNKLCYEYYKNFFNFKDINIISWEYGKETTEEYIENLNQLPAGNYFYIFTHHRIKEERLNAIIKWAHLQHNTKIYMDKHKNSLILFTKY